MAATERLSLLIESQTRGSRDVNKLAEELNKVTTIAERSNQRVEKSSKAATDQLGQVSGKIRRAVSDPIGTATQAVGGFASKLGVMGIAVGGSVIGLGALTGAAFAFMKQMGEVSDMMLDFSDRTGLTVNQVDKLQAMSKIAGVNMGVMERAAGQLAQNLLDTGASGERLRGALRDLNVETITATGSQREMGPIIWDTVEAISRLSSQTEQAAKANTILGISGKELVPLIRNYKEMSDRVERLGFGKDGQLIRDIDETRKSMVELGLEWDLLKRKLAIPAKGIVEISIAALNAIGGTPRPGAAPDGYAQGRAVAGGYGPVLPGIVPPNLTPSAAPAFAQIEAMQQRLSQQNKSLLAEYMASAEGVKNRLSATTVELATLRQKLQSGGLSSGEIARYRRLQGQQSALERLAAGPGKSIPAADIHGFDNPFLKPADVRGDRYQQALGVAPGVPFFGTAPGTNMAEIDPARGAEIVANLTRRRVDLMKQNLDYEIQINRLMAGPGGEVAAINQSASLRLDAAQRIYEITKDQARLELDTSAAIAEREVALLQLRRQGMTDYRNSVVNSFDALISGGRGGLSSFFASQGLGTLRGVIGNVAEQTYRPGLLTLPGQGTAESPNLLGKLLAGTPFGLDPASATMDNTRATIENTAALRGASITGIGRGLPGGGIGGPISAIASALGGKAGGGVGKMLDPNLIGLTGAGAAIPSAATGLLGTLGAIAPWIGVGLAGAGIVASLLPDPKQERAKQIELRIETARITVEGPAEFHLAGGTNEAFDYDFTGKPRVYQMSDEEVANSVVRASQAGHRINEEMRSAVLG